MRFGSTSNARTRISFDVRVCVRAVSCGDGRARASVCAPVIPLCKTRKCVRESQPPDACVCVNGGRVRARVRVIRRGRTSGRVALGERSTVRYTRWPPPRRPESRTCRSVRYRTRNVRSRTRFPSRPPGRPRTRFSLAPRLARPVARGPAAVVPGFIPITAGTDVFGVSDVRRRPAAAGRPYATCGNELNGRSSALRPAVARLPPRERTRFVVHHK